MVSFKCVFDVKFESARAGRYNCGMSVFKDTDELRIYLKTIKTYDEYWENKEPDFDDVLVKAVYDERMANNPELFTEEGVLLSLKQYEVRRFVEEQKARAKENLH